MSDIYDDYQGDTGGVSQDELLTMLINMGLTGGEAPGKTQANQLSYVKSLADALGVPLTAFFGMDTPGEVMPEFQSATRSVYGGNPEYGQVFSLMDQGYDPVNALKALGKERGGQYADNFDYDEAYKIATEYGMEKAKYDQEKAKADSKYVDYGTKSEYDLLGRPSEQSLVDGVVKSRSRQTSGGPGLPKSHGGATGVRPGLNEIEDFQTRRAAKARIARAKNTQVRSAPNQQLVNMLLGISALQGG